MILVNEAGKLDTEYNYYTEYAFNAYKHFNPKIFNNWETIEQFKDINKLLNTYFNSKNKTKYKKLDCIKLKKNKKVLVAYSGGLDSTYQAFKLRELGYDVYLLYVRNINYYENGQCNKLSIEFAKKFKFPIYTVNFSPNFKSEYKKYWEENPFKDFLIYSICIDYAYNLGIGNISSGDDMRLSIKDAIPETNISDSRELTEVFFKNMQVKFIPVKSSITKDMRLSYIRKKKAGNYYNSCVGPGRLILSQNKRYSEKFNIKLDKWNCVTCRKCCFHILADYYYNNKKYPKELIDRCWEKVAIGTDKKWFDPNLDIKIRIDNLRNY